MKVQLVLPLALLTSVLLVGLLKMRKRDHEKDEKLSRFQDIKLRVTSDVLQEYQKEKIEMQHQLEKVQGEQKAMEEEVKVVKTKAEKAAGDLTGCESSQKSGTDQQAAEETKLGNLKAQTEKEKTEWNAELDRLKKQLTEKSPVCNFLKEYPDQIKTMCGIKEEPKAEPPKQEEKKEPPKQEEKKEPPKQEEKKEEPQKQEEKKEPPKQEEKKEPPKQEEKKVEPPKQEEKKEEPPKQEEKKEPPKQEEKKEEPPKQEEKKEEPKKQEEKKEEPPKQEEKKEEPKKQEEKKEEPPKQEEKKEVAPKQ